MFAAVAANCVLVMPNEIEKLRDELRKEFRKDIAAMSSTLERDFRKENRELQASTTFCSKQYDDMTIECTALKEENKTLKAENAALSSQCDSLKKLLSDMEQRLTDLEQYSRNKNIDIKGLPVVQNEHLPDMLKKIGEIIKEPITQEDVDVCHRVPMRNSTCPTVVVQFHNRTKRDAVLAKVRQTKVTTRHLGHEENVPIYINETLCPTLRKLMGMAVARKKEKLWKFAWTKNGRILARKDETSQVVRVACMGDLDKII